jgi:hypothetical protein
MHDRGGWTAKRDRAAPGNRSDPEPAAAARATASVAAGPRSAIAPATLELRTSGTGTTR